MKAQKATNWAGSTTDRLFPQPAKAPTAKVRAKSECAFCHIAGAKKDQVWTQFYRLLDK
jgi:hypothetical protein